VPDGIDPAFNWNVGKAGQAAAQKLKQPQADYGKAAKQAASAIAALDAQTQNLADKKEQLAAQKADYEDAPGKKQLAGQKKTLAKRQAVLQKKRKASRLNPIPASVKTPLPRRTGKRRREHSGQKRLLCIQAQRGFPFGRGHGKIHAVSQRH
jgi:hypothetical protein